MYKNVVPIPPLGLVDDLLTISKCGLNTSLMAGFINTKSALKKLQFSATKCVKLHVGKTGFKTICTEEKVDSWKLNVVTDPVTGSTHQTEMYTGQESMKEKSDQIYLGDIIEHKGKHDMNIKRRKHKSIGSLIYVPHQ